MGDLSKNFSRHEFACKCGCGFDTIDAETLRVVQDARFFVGKPITPSSGARCRAYNRKIGSKDSSQHVVGRAVDLPVKDPKKLYDYLCRKWVGKYGFGLYKTFVHIDTRTGDSARWQDV